MGHKNPHTRWDVLIFQMNGWIIVSPCMVLYFRICPRFMLLIYINPSDPYTQLEANFTSFETMASWFLSSWTLNETFWIPLMIDRSCLSTTWIWWFQQLQQLNWTTIYSGNASEEDEMRLTGALLERLPDLQVLSVLCQYACSIKGIELTPAQFASVVLLRDTGP